MRNEVELLHVPLLRLFHLLSIDLLPPPLRAFLSKFLIEHLFQRLIARLKPFSLEFVPVTVTEKMAVSRHCRRDLRPYFNIFLLDFLVY